MISRNFDEIRNEILIKNSPFQVNYVDYLTSKYFSIESDVFAYENIQDVDVIVQDVKESSTEISKDTLLVFISNNEITDKSLIHRINNLHAAHILKYSDYESGWSSFKKMPAINPDYSLANLEISAGSGFLLDEIKLLSHQKKYVYFSILNEDSISSISKLRSIISQKSLFSLCEVIRKNTQEYIPFLINGEKKVLHSSTIQQKNLQDEAKLATYNCTGNFIFTSEYIQSLPNLNIKKVRNNINKRVLDCIHSDLIESIPQFEFVEKL